MRFDAAIVREQGVNFAVVAVKRHVVNHRAEAQSAVQAFSPTFPGMPVILMGQDSSGRPTYFGRPDIVRFLSHISPARLPWRQFTIN